MCPGTPAVFRDPPEDRFAEEGRRKGEPEVNKILKRFILVCVILIAAIAAVAMFYLHREWNRTTYFNNTSINGFDASNKTPADLYDLLSKSYSAPKIHLLEGESEQAVWTLEELGYTVDEKSLQASLQSALSRQKSSLAVFMASMMNGNSFDVQVPFLFNQGQFSSTVAVSNMASERIPNQDAELVYKKKAKTYTIKPEVQGTELRDMDLQIFVQQQTDQLVEQARPQEDLYITIPQHLYVLPYILSTDTDLNNEMNAYNSYDQAVITYTFGSQTEEIDWDTIRDWVFMENGEGMLSEERIREYVMNLAARYNTCHYPRHFHTSVGTDITIADPENEYGYTVDEEGEYQQLVLDIQSNSKVTREPVYSVAGVRRDGMDDLSGTYVEVNLSLQHLWFYKDYSLISECDLVSGCVSKGTETQTGCFPIAYKQSPATLTGQNAVNGWRTDVSFWMPFFEGQGLHDATWRSSFGGNIYVYDGSHGCVNLPYYAAQEIYNSIETGTAIILYK